MSSAPANLPGNLDEARVELNRRCNSIEECYEFMLAYAAQGVASDANNSQVREFLRKCDTALTGLANFLTGFIGKTGADTSPYLAFMGVIERDARDAQAAVQMVLAQQSISSQLVDNLNASIHLRALLTDLFLIDEVLKTHRKHA